ncbi:protein of unknown function [Pararobbsia alpina]
MKLKIKDIKIVRFKGGLFIDLQGKLFG